MQFVTAKGGWSITFLEEELKTSLPRRFVFQDDVKILDLARHDGAESDLAESKRSSKVLLWVEVRYG